MGIVGTWEKEKRAPWNEKIYQYFYDQLWPKKESIEDLFGIWERLVQYWNSLGDDDSWRTEPSSLIGRIEFISVIRQSRTYNSLEKHRFLPRGWKHVLKTSVPLAVMKEVAKAMGAVSSDKCAWLTFDVNQEDWEDCFVAVVLEYEEYIRKRCIEEPASRFTLSILYS